MQEIHLWCKPWSVSHTNVHTQSYTHTIKNAFQEWKKQRCYQKQRCCVPELNDRLCTLIFSIFLLISPRTQFLNFTFNNDTLMVIKYLIPSERRVVSPSAKDEIWQLIPQSQKWHHFFRHYFSLPSQKNRILFPKGKWKKEFLNSVYVSKIRLLLHFNLLLGTFVLPRACCQVEGAGWYFGHIHPTQQKQGARIIYRIWEMKDPTYYLRGRDSAWQKGMDFLPGDGQRLLAHCSAHNLPWPSRDLFHCSMLSSARGKGPSSQAGRGADLDRAAALDRVASHSQQKGSRRRGSCWAPPGRLCEAALEERQNHHPASSLEALSNAAVYVSKQIPLSKVWVDMQPVNSTFPGPGGFAFCFPFLEHQWETKAHNSFYLCFCNSRVTLYSQ